MRNIQRLVRYALTLLLCYGVYTETGKWTAIAIFLLFAATEIIGERIR